MHLFGTTCFAYVQNKKKLDARSEKGVFVGYDKGSPAYLVYFPETGVVKRVRCVKFTEKFERTNKLQSDEGIVRTEISESPNKNEHDENEDVDVSDEADNEIEGARRYPQRQRSKPKYLEDFVTDSNLEDSTKCTVDYCYKVADVPKTYQEAIKHSESCKWQVAMNEEMAALIDNDTFELTSLPEGRSVIGGRWVYSLKCNPNGEDKFKARYVAKGYTQVSDVDYHETFSPTARITSVRMLIQLAVQNDMVVHQMDVKTAYLNAPIDCEIYVKQPDGFEIDGKNGEKLVCKLKKSLYGLKQSGRNWNNMLHKHLIDENFEHSLADPCVYYIITEESVTIIIIWVDDIIIAASSESLVNKFKRSLSQKFKMKDLGILSWFLAVEFKWENGCIEMTQSRNLEKILKRFKMSDCKP